ncbi:hypothetical protein PR202_gb08139 [Eleusine coracana subsp. coracana]|uniref:Major facilitator superfamily (MFS) profile domain-containing protein n=1 Tax=Eleusine coracana subsp. coracana TaxID=191504 RepID=A0AAV5EBE6_ELECO|nr:hypothetical protein PR202_gb08139 [Eleusine coracana subsp. coracana]
MNNILTIALQMEEQSASYTVDDALLLSGFGRFQISILAYAGIGLIAEAMEMMLLSFVGPSVQLEWKLTSHQESMITSVVFVGMLIGAYSWGVVSDNYGRRQVQSFTFTMRGFLFTAIMTSSAGFLSSFAPNYLSLMFLRFLVESPRFLVMKGRTTEAVEVLEKMARLNNVQLPSGMLVSDKNIELDEVSGSSESTTLLSGAEEFDNIEKDEGSDFGGMKSIGKLLSPNLIRATLLLWMAFFGNAFAYYGIVLLTSELSHGILPVGPTLYFSYDNYLLMFVVIFIIDAPCFLETEIPGALLSAMVVDRFGRRLSMASMLFSSCVFLFPLVFSRTELLTRISLFGARLCISASFTIIYIYAPEIYPTTVRSTGIGIASSVGRIGGILCPLVAVAMVHSCHQTTAILLFELVVFLSGLAVSFFPFETKGCKLNDTEVTVEKPRSCSEKLGNEVKRGREVLVFGRSDRTKVSEVTGLYDRTVRSVWFHTGQRGSSVENVSGLERETYLMVRSRVNRGAEPLVLKIVVTGQSAQVVIGQSEIWMVNHESDVNVNLLEPDFIKNNAKVKNALFACISKDVFARLDASSTSHVEEINALGDDFKLKPVEMIRRFLRLFKDPKYESIITFTLQGDVNTKTMKDVLGKITAFESYRLGLDVLNHPTLLFEPRSKSLSRARRARRKL